MTRITFSEAARLDRKAIVAHTVERFGIGQARRFRSRFEATIQLLADRPFSAIPAQSSIPQVMHFATSY